MGADKIIPQIGSIGGGVIGSFFGPVGTMAGSAIGKDAGTKIGDVVSGKQSFMQAVMSGPGGQGLMPQGGMPGMPGGGGGGGMPGMPGGMPGMPGQGQAQQQPPMMPMPQINNPMAALGLGGGAQVGGANPSANPLAKMFQQLGIR